MRIKCDTIDGFLKNLDGADVHRKTVHYNRSQRDVGEVSVEIWYQVSAVVRFEEDDGEALVEAGMLCGIDRDADDGGTDGTREQERLHNQVLAYCVLNDLKPMPGILDI